MLPLRVPELVARYFHKQEDQSKRDMIDGSAGIFVRHSLTLGLYAPFLACNCLILSLT